MLRAGEVRVGGTGGRILIVDDEEPVRTLLSRFLSSIGYETAEAATADQACSALNSSDFQVVDSDIQMPGRNGLSLLSEIQGSHPQVAVVMLTGCEDVSTAVEAMKAGAHDYVLKPFDLGHVAQSVARALERHGAMLRKAGEIEQLEETVRRQTQEIQAALGHLDAASEATLEALVTALDAREHETHAHSRRVAEYSMVLGEALGVSGEDLNNLRRGAMLHDVGKIGVPDHILLKPGPLTDAEWSQMRQHPIIGSRILNGVESLRPAAHVVLSHHERFDGLGYPSGLKGEAIPLGARVFSVADSLEAITSDRPYQKGRLFESAREDIGSNAGAQFDPEVVRCFLSIDPAVWKSIRERTSSQPVSTGHPKVARCR
jgi:response regulator RpfG family c-di-GMP phosphodiesterase